MPVVVDSREQLPYEFADHVAAGIATLTRAALPTGDYSILGYEDRVAIERKSLADYVSTVIHARERFSRELQQLARYELRGVVVEGSLEDVLEHRYKTAAFPNSIWGATISIVADHCVPVYWCGSRPIACRFTFDLLRRWWVGHLRTKQASVRLKDASIDQGLKTEER
jgi:DNA excision repair protein ERCC-4